ncbi:nitrate respiration regulation response regulator NreC [Rhabdobacter roseus]|uniref:DNA-binding NarL/FixJ family response regulator n=1 Tax=Rhabdobacter roseus TaxID=1655419 RepID=A0A840TTS8_9BACT|nr:response regulator transcription factor [Rhabdobacter roseus]MBB5284673.1 DNA-binding NarL/FixJ family response regulator [Rhabdobacter roseus]
MTKILIADDHQLFNDGMKMMLSVEDTLEVVGQVFSGKDVLHAVHTLQPDLLLLDINMPQLNGLEVAEKLRDHHPTLRIIMLTMYSDRKFVEDCSRLGVPGYILKNSGVDEVLNAIETVLAGKKYYDPKLTKSTAPNQHADDSFQRQFQLTKREIEIIGLIGQSFTNEEIADRLFLSVATVKTHRNNINLKLGIKQPADLVRFAIEHGLA